jgi:hypothetical protein
MPSPACSKLSSRPRTNLSIHGYISIIHVALIFQNAGGVFSFAIDPSSGHGMLRLTQQQLRLKPSPCTLDQVPPCVCANVNIVLVVVCAQSDNEVMSTSGHTRIPQHPKKLYCMTQRTYFLYFLLLSPFHSCVTTSGLVFKMTQEYVPLAVPSLGR